MSSGGMTCADGTTPTDGLIDVMPQQCAGLRSDPPMSLPKPIGLMPLDSAEPSPPLEPPAVRVGVPRVVRHAVQRRLGGDPQAQVGKVGAADRDRARGPHPLDHRRVDRHDRLGERDERAASWVCRRGRCSPSPSSARRGARRAAHPTRRQRRPRAAAASADVVEPTHDGVQLRVHLVDAGEVRLHHLDARSPPCERSCPRVRVHP